MRKYSIAILLVFVFVVTIGGSLTSCRTGRTVTTAVADTEACVLPGINSAVGMVTESRKYETQLTAMVKETIAKGEQAFITII